MGAKRQAMVDMRVKIKGPSTTTRRDTIYGSWEVAAC
jgi:hypothetical protein